MRIQAEVQAKRDRISREIETAKKRLVGVVINQPPSTIEQEQPTPDTEDQAELQRDKDIEEPPPTL